MKRFFFDFVIPLVFISQVRAQTIKYFPHNSRDKSGLDSFTNSWYSEQLTAMKEPVIFTDKTKNEVYRFTWLRTFHHPVAIRIEKHNDSYVLYWKMCDGAGGYKPGKLIVDRQKTVTRVTWEEFTSKLRTIGFWQMSTSVKVLGNDGAEWILEGKLVNDYHVVTRWTPNASSDYYKCCDYLIGLTDLKIIEKDKY